MTNYSFQTSLPAYQDNGKSKKIQAETILTLVTNGAQTIKELSIKTGLPSSTIAGRTNDLIKIGKVKYDGIIEYDGRKRKKIVLA